MPRAPSTVIVRGAADGLAGAVRTAAASVGRGEQARVHLVVTFVGKARMRRCNRQYFGHDEPTDVMSFALPQPDGSVAGDVLVCRCVAASNARRHRVGVREEVLRLVVHGTLHALGWDHPAGAARTRSPMWRRQERYLAALR